jgi:hypothetical protein
MDLLTIAAAVAALLFARLLRLARRPSDQCFKGPAHDAVAPADGGRRGRDAA